MKKIVVGHKNPDTDTVVSSVVMAELLNKEGDNFTPVLAGPANNEIKFVFSYFKEKIPKVLKNAENFQLFLVDHNDPRQIISGGKAENVIGVLDHHQLGGLQTSSPIFYRCEPLGATATLVFKLFKEKEIKLTKRQASLLMSGIISDTLNFNSPTATKEDRQAVKEMNKIAKLDIKDFSKKMFQAKSDISKMNLKDVLKSDLKEWLSSKNKKIGISVWETVSTDSFQGKTKNIILLLDEIKKEMKFDFFFFFLVDIINIRSTLYIINSKEKEISQKAFNKLEKDNIIELPGFSSRKKQMAPALLKAVDKF